MAKPKRLALEDAKALSSLFWQRAALLSVSFNGR